MRAKRNGIASTLVATLLLFGCGGGGGGGGDDLDTVSEAEPNDGEQFNQVSRRSEVIASIDPSDIDVFCAAASPGERVTVDVFPGADSNLGLGLAPVTDANAVGANRLEGTVVASPEGNVCAAVRLLSGPGGGYRLELRID